MTAAMDPAGAAPGAWVLPVKCRLEEAGLSETRLLLLRRAHLDELHCKLGWLFNLQGRYQLKYLDRFGDLITFSSDEEFQLALNNFSLRSSASSSLQLTTQLWQRRGQPGGGGPPGRRRPAGQPRRRLRRPPQLLQRQRASVLPAAAAPQTDCGPSCATLHSNRRRAAERCRFGRPPRRLPPRLPAAAHGHPAQVSGHSAAVQASLAGYRQTWPPKASTARTSWHFGIECSRCGTDPLIGWRFKCSLCPNYNMCAACFHRYSHGHGFYRLPTERTSTVPLTPHSSSRAAVVGRLRHYEGDTDALAASAKVLRQPVAQIDALLTSRRGRRGGQRGQAAVPARQLR
uniref:ZZ-type domain-containing protein n=1 Tax=Macrostomum lignano TaxID=282301 RepID=A0A1I8F310_9PLAT